MEPCIPTDSSLANPSIYTTVLHTLTCILVPVNLFGAYCILFKTPKKMESVKWLMFSLHCFSALLDLFFSLISVPYLFLPTLTGYALGVWDNPSVGTYVVASLVGGVDVAILTIFENRYYVLFGQNTWWEKVRKPLLIINYLLIPLFFLPIMFMIPDQEVAFEHCTKVVQCKLERSFENRQIFTMAIEFLAPILSVVLMTIWTYSQIITYFLTILFRLILRNHRSTVISAKTNQLQRKFVIALSLQTFIPVTVLFTPISYLCLSVSINYHNQSMNSLIFIIFSLHGILSSTVMISVHEPYREFAKGLAYQLIRKAPRNRRISTVQPSMSHLSIVK